MMAEFMHGKQRILQDNQPPQPLKNQLLIYQHTTTLESLIGERYQSMSNNQL